MKGAVVLSLLAYEGDGCTYLDPKAGGQTAEQLQIFLLHEAKVYTLDIDSNDVYGGLEIKFKEFES